jgi:replicative DNA helicase
LHDSGSTEQDADIVSFPIRQEVQDKQSDIIGIELIIAKQRNGPLGRVPLAFLRRFAKFIKPAEQTEAHFAPPTTRFRRPGGFTGI